MSQLLPRSLGLWSRYNLCSLYCIIVLTLSTCQHVYSSNNTSVSQCPCNSTITGPSSLNNSQLCNCTQDAINCTSGYQFLNGTCKACNCSKYTSLNPNCNNQMRQCSCKENVTGQHCTSCETNFRRNISNSGEFLNCIEESTMILLPSTKAQSPSSMVMSNTNGGPIATSNMVSVRTSSTRVSTSLSTVLPSPSQKVPSTNFIPSINSSVLTLPSRTLPKSTRKSLAKSPIVKLPSSTIQSLSLTSTVQSLSPTINSPSPTISSPSPMVNSQSPTNKLPSSTVQSPSPTINSPSPTISSPLSMVNSQSPTNKLPSSTVQSLSPTINSPSPMVNSLSPTNQLPSPTINSPSSTAKSPSSTTAISPSSTKTPSPSPTKVPPVTGQPTPTNTPAVPTNTPIPTTNQLLTTGKGIITNPETGTPTSGEPTTKKSPSKDRDSDVLVIVLVCLGVVLILGIAIAVGCYFLRAKRKPSTPFWTVELSNARNEDFALLDPVTDEPHKNQTSEEAEADTSITEHSRYYAYI